MRRSPCAPGGFCGTRCKDEAFISHHPYQIKPIQTTKHLWGCYLSFDIKPKLQGEKGRIRGGERATSLRLMALRVWASSAANALGVSCASRAQQLLPAFSLSRCFSSVVEGLKYANSHEWVKHDGPVAIIGITDHAQDHLGEVVFVDLPETGGSVSKGGSFGAVESVKASSDVNSPISGEIVEVNTNLTESPGVINSSPYEDGWMIKVKPSDPAELETLMGPGEYAKFCDEEDAAH